MAQIIWGTQPYFLPVPAWLDSTVEIFGMTYPSYRFAIIVAGLLAAVGSHLLIHKTRLGMLIRAGSVNPQMVGAPCVNLKLLNALLFALGAAPAGQAGVVAGPLLTVPARLGRPGLT